MWVSRDAVGGPRPPVPPTRPPLPLASPALPRFPTLRRPSAHTASTATARRRRTATTRRSARPASACATASPPASARRRPCPTQRQGANSSSSREPAAPRARRRAWFATARTRGKAARRMGRWHPHPGAARPQRGAGRPPWSGPFSCLRSSRSSLRSWAAPRAQSGRATRRLHGTAPRTSTSSPGMMARCRGGDRATGRQLRATCRWAMRYSPTAATAGGERRAQAPLSGSAEGGTDRRGADARVCLARHLSGVCVGAGGRRCHRAPPPGAEEPARRERHAFLGAPGACGMRGILRVRNRHAAHGQTPRRSPRGVWRVDVAASEAGCVASPISRRSAPTWGLFDLGSSRGSSTWDPFGWP